MQEDARSVDTHSCHMSVDSESTSVSTILNEKRNRKQVMHFTQSSILYTISVCSENCDFCIVQAKMRLFVVGRGHCTTTEPSSCFA